MHLLKHVLGPNRGPQPHLWNITVKHIVTYIHYRRLSLSRILRDSLKYFEISVPWHIRFAEVYVIRLLKLEIYWKYCGKEEKLLLRSIFSSFLPLLGVAAILVMWLRCGEHSRPAPPLPFSIEAPCEIWLFLPSGFWGEDFEEFSLYKPM